MDHIITNILSAWMKNHLFNGGMISRKSRFASISDHSAYELLIGTAYWQFEMAPYSVSENRFQEERIGTPKCYQPQIWKQCCWKRIA
jgi:hypothetical protein